MALYSRYLGLGIATYRGLHNSNRVLGYIVLESETLNPKVDQ